MSDPSVDPLNVRAYQSRLAGLAAIKDADWMARQRARTPAQRMEVGAELRIWAQEARPGLDRARDRESDLQSHARVAALMRRADAWFAR